MSASSDPCSVSVGIVLDNHMSMQAAAEYPCYNLQYLRRLLCNGAAEGAKIGQMWMVMTASLEAYLKCVQTLPV